MDSSSRSGDQQAPDLNSETRWKELYPVLQSIARRIVFSYKISLWRGQENDIAEDIAQETAQSLFVYMKNVEQGNAPPIRSLESLIAVVAQNKCRDSRRRDRHLVRMEPDIALSTTLQAQSDHTSPLDIAIDNVDQEMQFKRIAHIIARLPEKQRKALLIDLANRMSFDAEKTRLQRAFAEAGVQLRKYQQCLSTDPRERARHNALLYQAYKKVTHSLRGDEN